MSNLREDAEVFRLGLQAGALTVPDVVAWADQILAEHPDAAGPFFEIAVASPTGDSVRLSALLEQVPGTASREVVGRRLLALLLAWYDREPTAGAAIARVIGSFAQSGLLPERQFGAEPYFLDEYFSEPFYTPAEAGSHLREYLQTYSSAPAV